MQNRLRIDGLFVKKTKQNKNQTKQKPKKQKQQKLHSSERESDLIPVHQLTKELEIRNSFLI